MRVWLLWDVVSGKEHPPTRLTTATNRFDEHEGLPDLARSFNKEIRDIQVVQMMNIKKVGNQHVKKRWRSDVQQGLSSKLRWVKYFWSMIMSYTSLLIEGYFVCNNKIMVLGPWKFVLPKVWLAGIVHLDTKSWNAAQSHEMLLKVMKCCSNRRK